MGIIEGKRDVWYVHTDTRRSLEWHMCRIAFLATEGLGTWDKP